MRILITGGFGFIGGRLAVHLAQIGHQIIIGTRKQLTYPNWLPKAEVAIMVWDDLLALERCCKGVDVVIHTAGMNAKECAIEPLRALEFNGLATANLVASASRAGVKKFIYLSTAHVYAAPLVGVITELTRPQSLEPYATSHLAREQSVLNVYSSGERQGIVLRLSNGFGAPLDKDVNCWMLLVNDLCKQSVQTRRLVLQSSGMQHRDFIALAYICCVVEKLITERRLKNWNIFNVGSSKSHSVLEIAKFIQYRCNEVLGFLPELLYKKSEVHEQSSPLTFGTDNLNALGISYKMQLNTVEIDRLLQFCQATFNQGL